MMLRIGEPIQPPPHTCSYSHNFCIYIHPYHNTIFTFVFCYRNIYKLILLSNKQHEPLPSTHSDTASCVIIALALGSTRFSAYHSRQHVPLREPCEIDLQVCEASMLVRVVKE